MTKNDLITVLLPFPLSSQGYADLSLYFLAKLPLSYTIVFKIFPGDNSMINKMILGVCAMFVATGAFAALSCPAQMTIHCPADSQYCSVTDTIPAPWRLFEARTDTPTTKAFTKSLPLTHVSFIDNGPGYASCSYDNQDGVNLDLVVDHTSARPILSSNTKWVLSGSSPTQYSTYDCPNSAVTFTAIDPAVCPFNG